MTCCCLGYVAHRPGTEFEGKRNQTHSKSRGVTRLTEGCNTDALYWPSYSFTFVNGLLVLMGCTADDDEDAICGQSISKFCCIGYLYILSYGTCSCQNSYRITVCIYCSQSIPTITLRIATASSRRQYDQHVNKYCLETILCIYLTPVVHNRRSARS